MHLGVVSSTPSSCVRLPSLTGFWDLSTVRSTFSTSSPLSAAVASSNASLQSKPRPPSTPTNSSCVRSAITGRAASVRQAVLSAQLLTLFLLPSFYVLSLTSSTAILTYGCSRDSNHCRTRWRPLSPRFSEPARIAPSDSSSPLCRSGDKVAEVAPHQRFHSSK
jgi:hypothetical protein